MVQAEDSILMKLSIMQKTEELLSSCIPVIDEIIIPHLSASVKAGLVHPKISRGEQYRSMPYRILDFPRIFSGDDIFAVRTMFLWGNFFSVTLHLSGKYLDMYREQIKPAQQRLPESVYVCIHKDQWHHHFENDNYVHIHAIENWQSFVQEAAFSKLAFKFNLDRWEVMHDLLKDSYQQIGSLLI